MHSVVSFKCNISKLCYKREDFSKACIFPPLKSNNKGHKINSHIRVNVWVVNLDFN